MVVSEDTPAVAGIIPLPRPVARALTAGIRPPTIAARISLVLLPDRAVSSVPRRRVPFIQLRPVQVSCVGQRGLNLTFAPDTFGGFTIRPLSSGLDLSVVRFAGRDSFPLMSPV